MAETLMINEESIKKKIYSIRGLQVMLDRDLAELYGVETKVFNQAVKRNESRFPDDFRFRLTDIEKNELVTKCDRFNTLKHSSVNPYAFTEQGVSMLSAVLKSDIAIEMSVKNITKQLRLDLDKHNSQYPKIELVRFDASHDRFLIIDDKELYHIGASLKDLGKKWFAFSKFDIESFDILSRLQR